jgi:exopolysaccharide biosynthesis protein
MHIARIDLTAAGIGVLVTPGKPTPDRTETTARTTSEFLTEFKLQLAVNANFFFPFREKAPWDFYPASGDRSNAVGQAIANGAIYSAAEKDWAVLCFTANNRAQMVASGTCPAGTRQAVAGIGMIVQNGQFQRQPDDQERYSRTVVAIDRSGQTLWILIADDKQIFYSEGATLAELADLAIQLGADAAINLDGGGSTTLVVGTASGPQLLNSPAHTKIPRRERPVANHLGFYARPDRQPEPGNHHR